MRTLVLTLAALFMTTPSFAQQPAPTLALPLPQWTRFVDPKENAYQVDVPAGWNNTGGTVRYNALQVWQYTTCISLEQNVIITMNEPSMMVSYVVPTQMLAMAGLTEGRIYAAGPTRYLIRRYVTGEQFAAGYGQQHLPKFCTDIKPLGSRARPDVSRALNAFGMAAQSGEATFSCRKGDIEMTAYVFATSNTISGQHGAMWYVNPVLAFLAPTKFAGPVAGMMLHMLRSVQFNPQWVAQQEHMNMETARVMHEASVATSDSIMKTWEAKGAAYDKIMDEGSRERLGIDYYQSPNGTTYTVDNKSSYYWINNQGRVIGTPTDTAPNADFQRMTRRPPGG